MCVAVNKIKRKKKFNNRATDYNIDIYKMVLKNKPDVLLKDK